MLIRSTWTLSVSEPTVLPSSYSLELVKQLHQKLGLEMGDDLPAISYSGIIGSYSSSKDFLTFHPEEFYQLSLCGLQDVATKAIAHFNFTESLELFGAKFNIINREDEITGYEELYTTLVGNEPETSRFFDLKFITPTAFAQGATNLPLPVPSLMFRSWLERWNYFAPVYLGSDDLIAYLSDAIVLKKHKIQTRTWQLQRGFVNGFVGDVTLQVLNRADPLLANVANLLAQYSQFTGTGMKTRLGMGQTIINNRK
ncbi:CRISPR system precrRNA processing endoribonuclease RAMP protein Cas6 [Aetokthonos hydrillicola Thurmond2011]|jgi:CRISPR-associated endoribonuclease Cas6|uniref:CRISPR system precrRNA processing endoribonuclease RAMP protein Cas6 n=1 Tax=Aetokthonos hydrillicola Thurmond2011 TaxID=2712845 RepID=A0AAP5I8Z6_9CYAN|nr:CRISPR system precrRNA processing endoribonuclease RAMP protein Cas6 [Aetokthonos hydrillicola]MBO3463288.1 CRISPR system precrRNA processing endoribonuclease RAMP protein Cas6 [Aetokthonos hydrillicola CCALA 1050]MBW4591251.1 CRISPR system precrRNA processing endoribonuclease RAMP protein Cas6 [Aetokthonos hydrillicola CCALA 1050]MDR9897086.1 CRISPR system precrRNA processing endoribonuclease RAMP protein Cas6 [Aetokthonos hydrillicola Thurmond2011]